MLYSATTKSRIIAHSVDYLKKNPNASFKQFSLACPMVNEVDKQNIYDYIQVIMKTPKESCDSESETFKNMMKALQKLDINTSSIKNLIISSVINGFSFIDIFKIIEVLNLKWTIKDKNFMRKLINYMEIIKRRRRLGLLNRRMKNYMMFEFRKKHSKQSRQNNVKDSQKSL